VSDVREFGEEPAPKPFVRKPAFRLLLLASIIGGLWAVGYATGLHENLTAERLRALIDAAGVFGILVFCALFVIGQIVQVPGMAFIAASVFAWGWWEGAIISCLAATLAVSANLLLVRKVGGDLRDTKKKYLRAILVRLHQSPRITMVLARMFFITSPPLSVVLGLSGVRHRDHAIASLIGMTPTIFGWAWIVGSGLEKFGLSG
jgi:uncharacterized membrane protein YdjX (TVP38/TMEM64 family)